MVLSKKKFKLNNQKGLLSMRKIIMYVNRKKALYGLKQAPRAWYGRIDGYLVNLGFTNSDANPNLYYKIVDNEPLILVMYVNNLFLIGNEKLLDGVRRSLHLSLK